MVTGATGGIGRAIVERFAADGWRVLATDLSPEADFAALGEQVRYVAGDVTSAEQMAAAVEAASGHGRFLACIANAGITPEKFDPFVEAPREPWRTTLEVNVLGLLNTFQAAGAALLRDGQGGRLAATTSVAGLRSEPQLPAYSASKAGMISIVESLAHEFGPAGITVNAVAPGPVGGVHQDRVIAERLESRPEGVEETVAERFERYRNEGRPTGRMTTSEEVAAVFAWLLSDATANITGQVIVVDGGSVLV